MRQVRRVQAPTHCRDFNPRTREGCDNASRKLFYRAGAISIHAPVKGATLVDVIFTSAAVISIHAPVKGATTNGTVDGYSAYVISIHAPVKGATQ